MIIRSRCRVAANRQYFIPIGKNLRVIPCIQRSGIVGKQGYPPSKLTGNGKDNQWGCSFFLPVDM
jgi:hypothetical protein